jgi:hypothetical protein
MAKRYVLSGYVEQAMAEAAYDKLEDGTYAGHIPACQGVVAFGASLRECEAELQSTLEDRILAWPSAGASLSGACWHRLEQGACA